jgi:DNA-binding MarR family transcriptional regulator
MSRGSQTRAELIQALQLQMREVSAQAVMVSQTVADLVGVNSTDLDCADFLNIHGPMTAGELARRSGLTTGAITGVIDRLERKGWVVRERDPNDRRKVIVRSIQGEDFAREAYKIYKPLIDLMDEVTAQFTDEELEAILRFLRLASEKTPAALPKMRGE